MSAPLPEDALGGLFDSYRKGKRQAVEQRAKHVLGIRDLQWDTMSEKEKMAKQQPLIQSLASQEQFTLTQAQDRELAYLREEEANARARLSALTSAHQTSSGSARAAMGQAGRATEAQIGRLVEFQELLYRPTDLTQAAAGNAAASVEREYNEEVATVEAMVVEGSWDADKIPDHWEPELWQELPAGRRRAAIIAATQDVRMEIAVEKVPELLRAKELGQANAGLEVYGAELGLSTGDLADGAMARDPELAAHMEQQEIDVTQAHQEFREEQLVQMERSMHEIPKTAFGNSAPLMQMADDLGARKLRSDSMSADNQVLFQTQGPVTSIDPGGAPAPGGSPMPQASAGQPVDVSGTQGIQAAQGIAPQAAAPAAAPVQGQAPAAPAGQPQLPVAQGAAPVGMAGQAPAMVIDQMQQVQDYETLSPADAAKRDIMASPEFQEFMTTHNYDPEDEAHKKWAFKRMHRENKLNYKKSWDEAKNISKHNVEQGVESGAKGVPMMQTKRNKLIRERAAALVTGSDTNKAEEEEPRTDARG